MPEYASLDQVKDYLTIPRDQAQFDGKLNLIIPGVNKKIGKWTGDHVVEADLTLAACKLAELHYSKATGVSSEGDSDFKRNFETQKDPIPAEVMPLVADYLTDEYKTQYTKPVNSKPVINYGRLNSY